MLGQSSWNHLGQWDKTRLGYPSPKGRVGHLVILEIVGLLIGPAPQIFGQWVKRGAHCQDRSGPVEQEGAGIMGMVLAANPSANRWNLEFFTSFHSGFHLSFNLNINKIVIKSRSSNV